VKAIKYRPEIDGLRAFAVLPVILFHMQKDLLPGGNIGVDVFFVISGFLITSIIKSELEAGNFSFKRFWGRRIRRIVPAMTAVIAASLLFTYFFIFRGDRPDVAKQSLAAMFSFANIYFWRMVGDYWGAAAGDSPMLHTWSLSVEEQFYLFFPLIVWLVWHYRPAWLRNVISLIAVVSLVMFLYFCTRQPIPTFYLLPTRAWELAAGCYLAIAIKDQHLHTDAPLGLMGLCMIVASYFFVPVMGVGLVLAVIGTVLVIAFARSGLAKWILAQPAVVYTGKLSYSLYLWHWPVIVFATYYSRNASHWLLMGIIVLLSMASYYLVETPTRKKATVPAILACFALTVLGAVGLMYSPSVYDQTGFEKPQSYAFYYDANPHLGVNDTSKVKLRTVNAPVRDPAPDMYTSGGFIVGQGKPSVVVLGDSHGIMWSNPIQQVTEKLGLTTSFWLMNGVDTFLKFPLRPRVVLSRLTAQEKYEYDAARIEKIKEWKPDVVIVAVRWSTVKESAPGELIDYLAANAGHVVLIEQPPEIPMGNRNAPQYLIYKHYKPEHGKSQYFPMKKSEEYDAGTAMLKSMAERHKNITYIPTYDLYAAGDQVRVLDGERPVYLDESHLTDYGAKLLCGRIEQTIAPLVASSAERKTDAAAVR